VLDKERWGEGLQVVNMLRPPTLDALTPAPLRGAVELEVASVGDEP
jgi:hypothetical protein